ncbi:hypothetical protein [Streptomyces sp. H27-H5]|uniref:hypothetical protein n=1 Tax=Streptomyces sp. H27-H5 TaxID=2996460 RepID=UPI00226D84BF|nr:hypothetical protein [Streptomyces sp. H27-H5]MCY0957699.1 hypothetical protein [Streptomyces sp. H27-H5]
MATHTPEQSALAELDRLTRTFTQATTRLDEAREALHEGIVRHLRARSAPPGKLADHTPYDRNHVGRLAKGAGIPPLRGPNAGPAPEYDEQVEAAALAELDKLTAAFTRAEAKVEAARAPLQEAIVRHYAERTLTPGVISAHVPYDRNHVGRLVRAAGVPPVRGG